MMLLAHWPWSSAWVFGVLIAATDPVSVLATFKETGVTGRIRMLVEGESLLNDGVAAVLFAVAITLTQSGSHVNAGSLTETFLWQVVGGIGIGVLVGAGATLLASRPNADHLVETALTAVAAYGSFLLADRYHASGVLATVAAGMVMGNLGATSPQGSRFFTERGREVVEAFWEFAAFVVNSLIFLLIGIDNGRVHFGNLGWPLLAAAIALVWISRAMTVYPLCALFARSKHRLSRSYQNIMFWGGLRGALALALALSLPLQMADRSEIIIATFGVVAFSVVVQGIAMPFWLKRWGFMTPPGAETPETL
jgi:CPA1 family monovalent cation:H+ antiporter